MAYQLMYQLSDGKVVKTLRTNVCIFSLTPDKGCAVTTIYDDTLTGSHYINNELVTQMHPVATTQLKIELESKVKQQLNLTAKLNGGWDSIDIAVSAAGFDNPFRAQALKLATWWSEVWIKYYELTNDDFNIPSTEELLAALPVYQP